MMKYFSVFSIINLKMASLGYWVLIIGVLCTGSVFAETQARVHKVEIVDFQFSPKSIDAKPGDTITWINRDIAPHTATSSNGGWDTEIINMGQSKSIEVRAEMNLDYICKFHPGMKARIVVNN